MQLCWGALNLCTFNLMCLRSGLENLPFLLSAWAFVVLEKALYRSV